MARGELAQRVAVAAVGIPVVLGIAYLGGWPLTILLAAAAGGGAVELYRMSAARGIHAFVFAGALAAAVYVLVAGLAVSRTGAVPAALIAGPLFWRLTLILILYLAAAAIWLRGPGRQPLLSASVTVFGALYVGGTLAYAVLLRHLLPDDGDIVLGGGGAPLGSTLGTAFVVFPLALTWINDSCAYFAGRRWGRRKLIPSVSPGKTVEGAVAGVLGTVAFGALYAALAFEAWHGLPVGALEGAIGGLLIAPAAQVGDLVESLFKREAGVKDSGAVFPGHGGLLDRLDALLFTFPVAYWYLGLVLSPSWPLWL